MKTLNGKPLYVVTVISNPVRYKSRYDLYTKFAKYIEDSGAILYTVEQAFGERPFQITDSENPHHIQLRSEHELWHKENMLNIAISRLPADWQYVAWIDADVMFARPDWVDETLHQLQHHHVVQLFSHAQDLGPNHEPLKTHNGFVYSYLNDLKSELKGYSSWHPGFAWAMSREAFNAVGGLIDWAIIGSGDRHMALAFIGKVTHSFYPEMVEKCAVYAELLVEWEKRCEEFIKRDIGYVSGLLLHSWHGKKKDRGYADRWKLLTDTNYCPNKDIKRDSQGLWQLTNRSHALRDGLRKYFRSRNEDSTDL